MSFWTLFFIIVGVFFLFAVGVFLFIWKGWPAIDRAFERRHSPDVNRCMVKFHSGTKAVGSWSRGYPGQLGFASPLAITYLVKVEGIEKEITILNEEGYEFDGGYRRINVEKGSCCGHSPRVFFEKETAPFPDDIFNAHQDAYAEVLVARSLANENGIDGKLVAIVVIGLVVLAVVVMGILAGSGTFKKATHPTINNYYTTNQTSNVTTPIITGEVVQ